MKNKRISSAIFFLCCIIFLPTLAHGEVISTSQNSDATSTTIVAQVNYDRALYGVAPLSLSAKLSSAATKKAEDMIRRGYFAHYAPSGTSPWYWLTKAGYVYSHAGENLAMNFDSLPAIESAWMASPLHRANILKSLYTETGVGRATGVYEGRVVTFYVQLFGTPVRKRSA